MVNLITEAEQVSVPNWVIDLESFRRWLDGTDIEEKARIWFLEDEVWVDMSKEQVFSHVLVKTKMAMVLGGLVEAGRLGLFLGDGVRLSNVMANLSVKPDATFVATRSLESGQVRLVEGMEEGYLELEGTPDMVLEVVSQSSVRKDLVQLRKAYWEAGISEYWLVDARTVPLSFDILRRTAKGYAATRRRQGWLKSAVFEASFRLVQRTSDLGHPDYVLEVAP